MPKLVGVRGFEPPAPASRTQCSTRLSYTPAVARGYSEAPAGPQAALIHQRFLQRGRAAAAWRKSTARRLFVLDGCVLDEDRPHHTGLEAGFGAVSKLGIASGVAFDVMAGIIGQQSFTQIAVSTGMDAAPSYAGASAAGGSRTAPTGIP